MLQDLGVFFTGLGTLIAGIAALCKVLTPEKKRKKNRQ